MTIRTPGKWVGVQSRSARHICGRFNAVDVDHNGRLSQLEVVAALKATVTSLDVDRFDKDIASLWINWDANGDGFISYDEIFRESYGLLAYIREQYPARDGQALPPPLTDSHQW